MSWGWGCETGVHVRERPRVTGQERSVCLGECWGSPVERFVPRSRDPGGMHIHVSTFVCTCVHVHVCVLQLDSSAKWTL